MVVPPYPVNVIWHSLIPIVVSTEQQLLGTIVTLRRSVDALMGYRVLYSFSVRIRIPDISQLYSLAFALMPGFSLFP